MENQNDYNAEEIFSKALRAGRRTYFFDVRETKAGDYYLTITESKKFTNEDGTFIYIRKTLLNLILHLKRLVTLLLRIRVKRL